MEKWPLPAGWEWKTLAEVSEINPRRPNIQRNDDAHTSFVPMAAVDEVEGCFAEVQTRPYGGVKRGYTYFEENDVVFAKITPCMENGKAAIARGMIDGFGFGTTEFHVLRPRSGILPEWLHRYVRQLDFRQEAKEHFRGAVGQQRVPQDFLESYPIPIPYPDDHARSLGIQRRIVDRLDALLSEVAEARRLNSEIRADTGQVMEGAIREVFEVELALKTKRVPLGLPCHVIMGQSPPGSSYKRLPEGVPLLNGPSEFGPVHPRPVQWTSEPKKLCQPEDLLICVRGATTGRMNWADQSYCIGRGLAAIRPRDMIATDIHYVAYFLRHQSREILAAGRGSTFPNLPKELLEGFQLPVLDPDAQHQVVTYLDAVQGEVAAMQSLQADEQDQLREIEQAILRQAFRGEL